MKRVIGFGMCAVLAVSIVMPDIVYASQEAVVPNEKVDEILVETDAVGNVISKNASVTITGSNDASAIRDKTKLSNIANAGGEESFTQEEDGTLIWDNLGSAINYTGTLNEELPFSMSVTYYLNDQEIKPEDLAGKSGHIEVKYSFENRATVDVTVDGENRTTYVPFLAVTSISLPMDEFHNIESLDGGLVVEEFGDTYFMLGVATPGVEEALNLELLGLDKYVKFPESFGFSADVTNFQMPATITSVTPHAQDKLDFSQIKTSDNVDTQIEELIAATQKLVEGSSELAGGTSQFSAGINQFVEEFQTGLTQIADGSVQLGNELYDLESKKNALQGQAGELLTYLDSVLDQLNGFELPNTDDILTPEFTEAQEALKADATLLIEALETMKGQLEEVQAFAVEAQTYVEQITTLGNTVYEELSSIDLDQMIADATELAKEQATEAAKEELAGMPISEEQINTIINNIMSQIDISSVADEARVHIAKVEEILSNIPQIEIPEFQVDIDPVISILQDMEAKFTVLESVSGKQEEIADLLDSAHVFMDSIKENSSTLRKKSNELIFGLDFADSAIKTAQDYISSLKNAASEASQGTAEVTNGTSQLENGAKQLADGTEQYYKEGILTATDYARQATLQAFIGRCKAFIYAAREYTNISGIEEGTTKGSIRFTVQTAEIAASGDIK